jgi:hypothetical protein
MSINGALAKTVKRLHGGALAVVVVAALVVMSAAGISARAWLGQPRATVAAGQAVDEIKITAKQDGFTPAQVTRGAGRFRLTVTNQSGKDGLTYRVCKPGGEEVYRGQPTGSADWSDEFDLPTGQYVLTEVNNPAWLFYITVQ